MKQRRSRLAGAALAGIALSLGSPAASALQEVPGRGAFETAPGVAPVRENVAALQDVVPGVRREAWRAFLGSSGSRAWHAVWDAATGLPLRLWGAGIPAPGAVDGAAVAEAHARRMLAEHGRLLAPGVDPSLFELSANQLDRGLRTVAFRQRARLPGGGSVPVVSGQVSFRYRRDRLFVIGTEAVPEASASVATVRPEAAAKAALRWLGAGAVLAGSVSQVVLPLFRSDGVEARTVFQIPVTTGTFTYRVYIDARTGAPVARALDARFAKAAAAFDVPVRWPGGERQSRAAPLLELEVDGASSKSDATGTFDWPGEAAGTATLGVRGSLVRVSTVTGDAAVGVFPVEDGAEVDWSLADDETGDAQLSAYIHVGIAKDRARRIVPGMTFLGDPLKAIVNGNDAGYACNAYWNGESLNFFLAAGPCSNTGRLADVVYHEFGHAFHQHSIISGAGAFDGALSEGSSDYFACTITNDPFLAPGFYASGDYLRELASVRRWPDDVDSDPHETGLIYAGAMWDLRTLLVESLGDEAGVDLADRLDHAVLQRASSIPAAYAEVLAEDDDDGDLSNGTPHLCTIQRAFVPHGLTPFLNTSGLRIVHSPPSVLPPGEPYTFRATTKEEYPQCGAGDPVQRVEVRYRFLTGGAKTLTLTPDGEGYSGVFPGVAAGASLRYKVIATTASAESALPDNLADDEYEVFFGEPRVLSCEGFESGSQGWVFGDDDGGPGDFEWGEPQGLGGDPAAAHAGTKVIGERLGGTGRYRAGKASFAEGPVVDLEGESRVRLQLRRWLTVEDGAFDEAVIRVNGKRLWSNASTSEDDGSLRHIDKEWRFVDLDVTPIVSAGATTAQVRFELTGNNSVQLGGFTLDDVCLVAWTPPPSEPPDLDAGAPPPEGALPTLYADGGCACEAGGNGGNAGWGLAAALACLGAGAARRRMARTRA